MKPENEAIRDLATLMFHLQLRFFETTDDDLRKRTLLVMEMKSVQQKLVKQILAELTNLEVETDNLTKAVNSFRSSSCGINDILEAYLTLKQEICDVLNSGKFQAAMQPLVNHYETILQKEKFVPLFEELVETNLYIKFQAPNCSCSSLAFKLRNLHQSFLQKFLRQEEMKTKREKEVQRRRKGKASGTAEEKNPKFLQLSLLLLTM